MFANTFRAFRHRDYVIFWCGLLLGYTGALVQTTAQSWLIFQLTDSPFYLGLDGLCLGLPRVLFSAFGGALVDRADRKTIFIVTQAAFFVIALFLGVMDYLGAIRVWHLLAASALAGFFISFEQPVRQSILHHLVPQAILANAITLYQLVFNGSVLFAVLATIFMIRIPKTPPQAAPQSITRDMVEGLGIAWNTPLFFSLFAVLAIVTFCTKPYTQFMPVFARDILGVGAPGLGILLMAPGAGAIAGGLMLASVKNFPPVDRLLFVLGAGLGSAIILFAVSSWFTLSLFFLFLAGGFHTTFLSFVAALLQSRSDETNRGRIMSLYGLVNRGLGPMGAFPFGLLATAVGAPWTVALCGALTIGLAAYMALYRRELKGVKTLGE